MPDEPRYKVIIISVRFFSFVMIVINENNAIPVPLVLMLALLGAVACIHWRDCSRCPRRILDRKTVKGSIYIYCSVFDFRVCWSRSSHHLRSKSDRSSLHYAASIIERNDPDCEPYLSESSDICCVLTLAVSLHIASNKITKHVRWWTSPHCAVTMGCKM